MHRYGTEFDKETAATEGEGQMGRCPTRKLWDMVTRVGEVLRETCKKEVESVSIMEGGILRKTLNHKENITWTL